MTKSKHIPKRRFKGFEGEWENKNWVDTVNISTEMVDPSSGEFDNMLHIAPGNIESFTGRVLDNVNFVKEENLISGKFRFRPGDIVYGKINPQLGKYFYAKVDGLTSADAYVLNGKNNIIQEFLYTIIQSKDFFNYSVSVSKRSGMPKINREELNDYSYWMPEKVEQKKIGNFFQTIDSLITLHQHKLDKLKNLKKAYLAELFPAEGQRVPKRRFPGFEGEWESKYLGECFSERRESMADGELLSVTISKGIKKFSELGRHNNSNDDKSKYKKVCVGDIAYNSMRMWQGASGYSPYEGIVSPAYTVLSPKLDVIDSMCMSYFLRRSDMTHVFKLNSQGITSDNWNLKYPALSKIPVLVSPHLNEQHRIATYLSKVDCLIDLQQQKLDKLKDLKKAYLNELFV